MCPLTCSYFLLLPLEKLSLFALPFLHGICLPSLLSPPFLLRVPTLTCQGVALSRLDCPPPYYLVFWTNGSVPFPFGKGSFGILANCSLCGTEATLSFSAGPVCSSFSAKACIILLALRWSQQHQQVFHFSSPPI